MVHGIGRKLGFQAKAFALLVAMAALAAFGRIQHIARVELHAGHIGFHGQFAAGRAHHGRRAHACAVEDEIVVVSATQADLLVVRVDGFAHATGHAQVKGRAAHGPIFAGGDQALVHHGESVGQDLDFVIEHRAAALARQVEIAMVGEVHRRVRGGGRLIVQGERAGVVKGIRHHHAQRAGIALLAVRALAGKDQVIGHHAFHGDHIPDLLVEAVGAAVQVVHAVFIAGKLIVLSIQRKMAPVDAVAHAADQRAQVAGIFRIALHVCVAQRHVGQAPLRVRHADGLDDAAIVEDGNARAQRVGHGVALHLRAARQGPECLFLYGHTEFLRCCFLPSIGWIHAISYTFLAGFSSITLRPGRICKARV